MIALLTATATDRGPLGLDLDFGAGSLNVVAAVAATGATEVAPPPAPAQTAAPAKLKVTFLRVIRRGRFLVVRGKVTGHARVRVALRRSGARSAQSITGTNTKAVSVRAGTFTLRVPTARLRSGRYVLVLTASDRTGQRLGRATRGVRLR